MNSTGHNSPGEAQGKDMEASPTPQTTPPKEGLKGPPERPTLVAPPPRPVRPSPPKPEKTVAPKPTASSTPSSTQGATVQAAQELPPEEPEIDHRYLPIAPPSEPMQYRAIGLVRGTYEPTEADQLNRGNLTTEDGQVIDSVLLGRITSLVKKHLDLSASHLWVVYPRTRREMESDEDQDLHLQIVGVWEPETLGLPGESPTDVTEAAATETTTDSGSQAPVLPADLPPVDENFFSIRGEVVKYAPEDEAITVKILQGVKKMPGAPKSFKLMLKGRIEGRTVGYFWDFKVQRDGKTLVVERGSVVGIVPPKKRPKGGNRRGGPSRRGGGDRPHAGRAPAGRPGMPRPRKPGAEKDQAQS